MKGLKNQEDGIFVKFLYPVSVVEQEREVDALS